MISTHEYATSFSYRVAFSCTISNHPCRSSRPCVGVPAKIVPPFRCSRSSAFCLTYSSKPNCFGTLILTQVLRQDQLGFNFCPAVLRFSALVFLWLTNVKITAKQQKPKKRPPKHRREVRQPKKVVIDPGALCACVCSCRSLTILSIRPFA